MSDGKRPTYEERRGVLGCEPAWSREEVALFLGVSLRTVDALPLPRANIGGRVLFVPAEVREWLRRQQTYSLLTPAA